MNEEQLKEIAEVPDPNIIFEESIKETTSLRQVSTDEERKKQLEEKLKDRLADPEWGQGFRGGVDKINLAGRPMKLPELSKLSNREIREKELLNLCRKIKPYQTKAIQAIVKILDNPESSDQNKLKAAVFVTEFYKGLLKDTFDYRYDNDQGKEVTEDNTSAFSLKMIDTNE